MGKRHGRIDSAWDAITVSSVNNVYIEKTTGTQSSHHCYPAGSTWYNDDITINHYGGLTPTDSGTGWVHNAGDVSYVKSTDPDQPAFRVSKGYGTGNYGMDECTMRFDDMVIEGCANMGALLFNAIGYINDGDGPSVLIANRTVFLAGSATTNPCVVFGAAGWNTPGEFATPTRVDVYFDRVVVSGGDVGLRACAKTGGSDRGDSIYDIKNTAFINNGRYGLMAKGNNYGSWNTDCDVFLNHVTFYNCETAIWIGDAANGTAGYNTLSMTNVLVFLNNPTGVVIQCAEATATRKTRVYADYNAYFGYASITNGTDNIELTTWGPNQVLDPAGDPKLAPDGYHLVAGVSDDRIIDSGKLTAVAWDIDGDLRPPGYRPGYRSRRARVTEGFPDPDPVTSLMPSGYAPL